MTAYILFLRTYPLHVGFGFLLTFFSSLGQTFLISLYVPHILAELSLSNTLFGSLYAGATIASSFLLMFFGGRIDHTPLQSYLYRTIGALGAASLVLGLVRHPLLLPVALLGIRFSGQGLMGHISQTTMGRFFTHNRGKALSLTSLGYSVGEMVFPIIITTLIPLVGWRYSLMINALILLLVLIPVLQFFPVEELCTAGERSKEKRPGAPWYLLRTRAFWILAPSIVMLSFTNTGVFFYQLLFAESRGWSAEWYALVFSGYALSRFVFGLLGGPLVDRYSARRLYPFLLLPLIGGLLVFALVPHRLAAVIFLVVSGMVMGCSSPVKSAAFAELHGTEALGGVRSLYSSIMVFGSALGPVMFGLLLDAGIEFTPIFVGAAGLLALTAVNSFRILAGSSN